eukprot:scaffold48823_cov27-Tisochrysis_lutea.AAC.6
MATASSQISELQSLLRPYMLRRVKEDVIESLPKKTETLLKVIYANRRGSMGVERSDCAS